MKAPNTGMPESVFQMTAKPDIIEKIAMNLRSIVFFTKADAIK